MMARFRNLFKTLDAPEEEVAQNSMSSETAWSESQLYADMVPKYNPDELIGRKGADIYKKMMTDEQVKAVVKFKRDAITSRDHFFELTDDRLSQTEIDERIAIYNEMVKQVAGSFEDGLNFIMKATWQGFSMTEKIIDIFEYKDTPYLGLRRLSPKPFDSFEIFTDEFGGIDKVEQHFDSDRQDIDLDKFVYFVQNPDMDQHYGQSELREAYRSWYAKDIIIRFYNIYMERMAGGLIVLKPNEGVSIIAGTPEHTALLAVIQNVQTASGILLPPGVELDIVQPQATDQFEKAITMHDLQIAKALLVPNLLGISHAGQTGAFAQSQTQLEAFLWTLDADANRLVDSINEQIFDPISKLNFPDGIGPKLKFKPISEQKKLEIIKAWKELVSAGSVEATDTDEAHLRELFDFPEKGEPLKIAPKVPTNNPNDPNNPGSTGGDDDEQLNDDDDEETIMGNGHVSVSSQAAFGRALKRVSFTVIDRKTTDILDRYSIDIADSLADLVASVSLQIIDKNIGTPGSEIQPHELTFDKRLKTRTRKQIDAMLQESWDLGIKHAKDETAKARKDGFEMNMARIDGNAKEFLKSNSFRMVGNITDNMLKIIQAILANAIKYSWTPREAVRKVYDRLTLAGYVFAETNANATGRTVAEVLETIEASNADISRVKTAVRTNVFESLNEARYSAFTDPELDGFVEALEYSAILDSRTTDICTHLDGRVYEADDPVWNANRPPNHFNCRSVLVPVTIIDTDVEGKDKEQGSRWSKDPRVEPQAGFGGETG